MEVREPSAKYLVRPGYKQTEAGVIPEDWEVDSLARYWNVMDCKHVTAKFIANGYPIASIKEVQNRFVDLTEAKQTTQKFFKLLIEGGREPRIGDLILSRNATVGEVAQVAEWHPPFAMGQDVCLLRKRSPQYSTDFLQEVFRSSVIGNQLSDLMVGSTFKRANVQQIKNLAVLMPSPAEQEAIAEALTDADALITSLEQLLTKKRQLKQGAMRDFLTGRTRLPGFSGEWEVKTVGELGDCFAGGTPSTFRPDYWGGEICWLPSGRVQNCILECPSENEIRITKRGLDESAAKCIKAHSVLVAITGATCANVACLEFEASANQSVVAIEPNSTVNYYFLYYSMLMERDTILSLQSGSAQGGVNLKAVKSIPLRLPSLPEQTAIATILSDMDAEIAALEAKLAKARNLKQGMMQELLTGRIRLI